MATPGKGNGRKPPADEKTTSEGDDGNWWNFSRGMKIAGCAAACALGAAVAAPAIVAGMGFGAAGISAGSMAASMMSSAAIANGGGVAAGGLVATLQSIGAGGAAAGIFQAGAAATAGVGGAIATAFGTRKGAENDNSVKMPSTPPLKWTNAEVCQWVLSLKLDQHVKAFEKVSLIGLHLKTADVREMCRILGIESLGERYLILCSLTELFPESREVPHRFYCPITLEIMEDPVQASDGIMYERSAFAKWLATGNSTSPITNLPLKTLDVIANPELQKLIRSHKRP